MDLIGTMVLNIEGVSRYEFDGNRGAKVYAKKTADKENLNVIGNEIVEFSCDFDIFEGFRQVKDWPSVFRCEVEMNRGAKGKASARVLSAEHVKSAPASKAA